MRLRVLFTTDRSNGGDSTLERKVRSICGVIFVFESKSDGRI